EMRDELIKYVESNEIEEQDIPKVSTIQGWISRYAAAFKEQATEAALRSNAQNTS
ncbi:11294_t:CDS:1, partial [Diversispora eburnea]